MDYRILCTSQTICPRGGHIVGVGTGETTRANRQWSVRDVWQAMDHGDLFYTTAGGQSAWVARYHCPCGRGSLRSAADATTYNNLDSLRSCNWV